MEKVQVHYPVGAGSTANFLKKRFFLSEVLFSKKTERRPGIYSMHHPQNIRLKICAALEVNSWYLSVHIKYTWRLVGMNAYMFSCAPINLYLLIK